MLQDTYTIVGLMESMKAADLSNWSLNAEQFSDLASSLNNFFAQTGLLQQRSSTGYEPPDPASSPGKCLVVKTHTSTHSISQDSWQEHHSSKLFI